MTQKKKSFFRWVLVGGCTLIMATTHTMVNNSVSLFLKPVAEDLGFARVEFALCNTITALSAMLVSPLWGYLYSRVSIWKFQFAAVCGMLASFFLLGSADSIFHFYALAASLGIFFSGASILPVSLLITRLFSAKRGLALSIALAGSGLGGMILNPIISAFIAQRGWRSAYELMAVIILSVAVPIVLILFRTVPQDDTDLSAPDLPWSNLETADPKAPLSLKEALRFPWFYLYLFGLSCTSVVSMGCMLNIPAHISDVGYSPVLVGQITALYSGVLIFGKLMLGLVYDRYGSNVGTLLAGSLISLACLSLLYVQVPFMLYVMAVIFGLGSAIGTITPSFLTANLFGSMHYSSFYSLVQVVLNLGIAIGVPLVALFRDLSGSYDLAWRVLTGISLIMTACLLLSMRASQIYSDRLNSAPAS